jgi:hypothetical protein
MQPLLPLKHEAPDALSSGEPCVDYLISTEGMQEQ